VQLPLPPAEAADWVANLRYCASAGAVVHDIDSVGEVTEGGIHYWIGERDRRVLLEGLRQVARVYFAAGATAVVPGVHGVGVIRSVAEIERIPEIAPAHQIALYASHPMGTCAMGAEPSNSVVDPSGRVHGEDRVWVADASVFPTSLGVNPQVTVYAVGLTVGRQLAESLG
jgi:choline dehydrogenase-like flavoprotein